MTKKNYTRINKNKSLHEEYDDRMRCWNMSYFTCYHNCMSLYA